MERRELIRTIYLYLFSLVGLVLIVIGSVRLVDLGLKAFVFTKADQILIYPAYPRAVPLEKDAKALSPEEEAEFQEEQRKYEQAQRRAQRERTAAESLAMLVVGSPLFFYHWRLVQKNKPNVKL